jgi:drug/metabolite transporter (DMT)-like permease
LLLALVGVALVLKTPDTPWPVPSSATDYLALLGGASFALNNAMLRKLADLPESVRMGAMFGGGMFLTAGAALALLPSGQVGIPADVGWWPYALGFALCLLFSNLSLQYGAARLSANTTSLVMLSEILFAAASSVALGVSELSTRKLIGGLLIVFAAVLATIQHQPKEPT